MLAMANKHGYVSASVGGLAHEARVSREDCESALKVLTSPDKDSRSKEFDGRRIEIVDGGFQLLNHPKYRAMRSEEERKEYMKAYMIEYRARTKNVNNFVNNVSECKPPLAKAEADTEADTEAEAEADKKKIIHICVLEDKFKDAIGVLYKRRASTPWDIKEISKLKEILKRPDCEIELSEIAALYGSGYKYRRQNIITLLNQWSGELDRARSFDNGAVKKQSLKDDPFWKT